MDAVEFLKAHHRMRGEIACESCPLYSNGGCDLLINFPKSSDLRECVEAVEQWAKDHPVKPVKTRQSEFLKMFPNAVMDGKVLAICPITIRGGSCSPNDCARCRRDYWLQEVE